MTDELGKLQSLHWNGVLTDAEFTQAKARLIEKPEPPPQASVLRRPQFRNDGREDLEKAVAAVVCFVVGTVVFLGVLFTGIRWPQRQDIPDPPQRIPLNPYIVEFK
jgi:hypothetical protein